MKKSVERERMRRLGELLGAALEHDEAGREAFLDIACGSDAGLRRDIASLLAAHSRPGAVDRLAGDIAPLTARLRKPAPSLAGSRVGHYEVGDQLGGGGMGVVYRARDSRDGRILALKVLSPSLGGDETARERFRLEARVLRVLQHPNICAVDEVGETDEGLLYVVMPLYDGETLQRRVERGMVPTREALGIAVQVASALIEVHARDIIHRDIKPSNLMVTGDGTVKLLDFGIAKLAGVALTGPARPPGTMAYMSPELIGEKAVDHRTDIWSLGVVLYEMLAGRHPFPGRTRTAVLNAIQRAEPAPLSAVPPTLSRVVGKCLAPSPRARYPTAAAVGEALASLSP